MQKKYVKEKNLISVGGNLEQRAQIHVRRGNFLSSIGIETPRTYGAHEASIYQELITNDKTKEVMSAIRGKVTDEVEIDATEGSAALEQLTDIAAKLDIAGFNPLNFLRDLIYDGTAKKFYYVDYGSDLGEPDGQQRDTSLNTLRSVFPNRKNEITALYNAAKPS